MKTKLSQYTPRKAEWIIAITNVSTLNRKITLEYLTEIFLILDALYVMRKDTSTNFVVEIKVALTRRRETREYIMLMLQRMMNLPRRESNKKMNIFQVMKSVF